jgi:hypothetical protein
MDKLNSCDLDVEFKRVWQSKIDLSNQSDSYEIARIFFIQGYENGYLDGLKDGRAL